MPVDYLKWYLQKTTQIESQVYFSYFVAWTFFKISAFLAEHKEKNTRKIFIFFKVYLL